MQFNRYTRIQIIHKHERFSTERGDRLGLLAVTPTRPVLENIRTLHVDKYLNTIFVSFFIQMNLTGSNFKPIDRLGI